ncbi:hypothetical protein GIB67_039238 [Kingdonia uniflora]|uniref:Reticulon-like protein n=1 Tax=Kingdonia uniflora TaxID=39325 RepID=A0A7J7MM54_9MAGN|nr:hypothetical protein GIB67_039238 [Kingdonia uniflora]
MFLMLGAYFIGLSDIIYVILFHFGFPGTRNVIEACIECNVKRLIYTSSSSVVFDGVHGIFNGDESMPYPPKFIIGSGNNMYDFTYVENVAHAHVCAEQALASEWTVAERAAGQAYFITNMEPIKFWDFMSLILGGLGYERPSIKIPAPIMMPIAHVVEWTYKMLAPYGMRVPQLTPSRIRLLSCNRTFDCSKAKDRLGYTPVISLQVGINTTIASYSHLRAEHQTKREGPSKAHICLGSGKVAETLLWKDKKQTLTTLIVLISFYNYFITSGYTVITAVSKILLLATVLLFVHGILPAKIFGYTVEKIPASRFYFPEERCRQVALSAVSKWNSTANILNCLCKGKDWKMFFKVIVFLMILCFLGATPIRSIFVIGLNLNSGMPFAFVAFYLYEKNEDEIDELFHGVLSFGRKLKADVANKFLTSK